MRNRKLFYHLLKYRSLVRYAKAPNGYFINSFHMPSTAEYYVHTEEIIFYIINTRILNFSHQQAKLVFLLCFLFLLHTYELKKLKKKNQTKDNTFLFLSK